MTRILAMTSGSTATISPTVGDRHNNVRTSIKLEGELEEGVGAGEAATITGLQPEVEVRDVEGGGKLLAMCLISMGLEGDLPTVMAEVRNEDEDVLLEGGAEAELDSRTEAVEAE